MRYNFIISRMFKDDYYPKFLLHPIKNIFMEFMDKLDMSTNELNDVESLAKEVCEKILNIESDYPDILEIETVARDSIYETFEIIMKMFCIDIDIEELTKYM